MYRAKVATSKIMEVRRGGSRAGTSNYLQYLLRGPLRRGIAPREWFLLECGTSVPLWLSPRFAFGPVTPRGREQGKRRETQSGTEAPHSKRRRQKPAGDTGVGQQQANGLTTAPEPGQRLSAPTHVRYLIVLAPGYLLLIAAGLEALFRSGYVWPAGIVAAASVAALSVPAVAQTYRSMLVDRADYRAMARWVSTYGETADAIVATGRWSIAHRSPNRIGNSAASLSSGGMAGPRRVKVRKSLVHASDTSGPAGE